MELLNAFTATHAADVSGPFETGVVHAQRCLRHSHCLPPRPLGSLGTRRAPPPFLPALACHAGQLWRLVAPGQPRAPWQPSPHRP